MKGRIEIIKRTTDDKPIYPITVTDAIYVDAQKTLKALLTEMQEDIVEAGGGGGTASLNDLTDVTITGTPGVEDVLTYFGDGQWRPAPAPTGSGGGSGLPTDIYIVELTRWGISSNGTNAIATTGGLNSAFTWARDNKYGVVIVPPGTYLIDKDSSVKPYSNTHYKGYGALFIKETNSYEGYATILLESIRNTTLEGFKTKGDRETHTYVGGTAHEHGHGIYVKYLCYNILVKNCDSYENTGDGALVEMSFDSPGGMQHPGHFAKGEIDSAGNIDATKTNYTTVSKFFDLSHSSIQQAGYFFYAGDGYGGYGTGMNLNKVPIKVHFYKNDNTYLGFKTIRSYEFIYLSTMPVGAQKVRFSYLQNYDLMSGNLHYVLAAKIPHFIKFQGCKFYQNRRQGSSVTGGRFITYEDCEIFDIGNPMTNSLGTSPGFGIDVEDGYQANHKITVINCNFYDNKTGDFTCVSTRGVHVERNKFRGYVRYGGSGDDYLSIGNMYYGNIAGQSITSGVETDGTFCKFENDHIFGASLLIVGGNTFLDNCVIMKSRLDTSGESIKIYNCKFVFDNPDLAAPVVIGNKYLDVRDTTFDMRRSSGSFGSNNNCLKAIWRNVRILTTEMSSGTISTAKELIVEDCEFIHIPAASAVINHSMMIATESMRVQNNTFKNLSFRFEGGGFSNGSDKPTRDDPGYSPFLFKGNTIIWDSAVAVPPNHEARGQGVALLYFSRLDVIDNHVVVKGQTTTINPMHNLRVFVEAHLNLSHNTVTTTRDSGITTTGTITIDQSYRANVVANPRPKATVISHNNRIDFQSALTFTAALTSQLEKPIMGTAPLYPVVSNGIPTTGYYALTEQVINGAPAAGDFVGWVTLTAGYADSAAYAALTTYPVRSRILLAGKIYEAVTPGKSTATQPTFPTVLNTTVDDKAGTITWTASTARTLGQLIVPTVDNGYYYECTTAGTTSGTEPAPWSTVVGATVTNGSAVFTVRQIVKWRYVGVPAVFKPFGLISS